MGLKHALASVAMYNGWHDTLCHIREYIRTEMKSVHKSKYWNIAFPYFLKNIDPDMYPRVIWFLMVEMFGDCGTSPRSGWIDGDKSTAALEWINELCEMSGDGSGQ